MSTPFIYTKSPKSIGLAILLTILLGPVGLFYASISGAILMLIAPVFLTILFFAGILHENEGLLIFSTGIIIIFAVFYWLLNIYFAVTGVIQYNRRIETEAKKNYELWKFENGSNSNSIEKTNQNNRTPDTTIQEHKLTNKPSPREWLKSNPNKSINDYYSRFGQ